MLRVRTETCRGAVSSRVGSLSCAVPFDMSTRLRRAASSASLIRFCDRHLHSWRFRAGREGPSFPVGGRVSIFSFSSSSSSFSKSSYSSSASPAPSTPSSSTQPASPSADASPSKPAAKPRRRAPKRKAPSSDAAAPTADASADAAAPAATTQTGTSGVPQTVGQDPAANAARHKQNTEQGTVEKASKGFAQQKHHKESKHKHKQHKKTHSPKKSDGGSARTASSAPPLSDSTAAPAHELHSATSHQEPLTTEMLSNVLRPFFVKKEDQSKKQSKPYKIHYRPSPTAGYVYRKLTDPEPRTIKLVQHLPKLPSIWTPLQLSLPQETVPPPAHVPVPRLAHDLKRVVLNEGVHPLKDFQDQAYMFNPFLAKIHQPQDINYDSVPDFVTTSKDQILHRLATERECKFKASTSSITSTLAQIYFLLTKFKSPDLSCLSARFQDMASSYTKMSSKPVCLFLRPKDGIYSIDSDQGNISVPRNKILLDLGKSLERMFTTEPEEYEREFLLTGQPTGKFKGPEAYHYLRMGDFLLRSQLDCEEPDLPGDKKTFDLKTRATVAVRLNMEEYQEHLNYRITSLRGPWYSYEREFYDMVRATMLKYYYQVRIGQMDGIFVCYHNTAEIFGFEYLKEKEMARILFGNSEFADIAFQSAMHLWQIILNEITSQAQPAKTLKVVLWTDPLSKEMDVFVEPVEFDSGWLEPSISPSSGSLGLINSRTDTDSYVNQLMQQSSPPPGDSLEHDVARYEWLKYGKLRPNLSWYKLRTLGFLNGRLVKNEMEHRIGDKLDVFYHLEEMKRTDREGIINMLNVYKDLLFKSYLYEDPEVEAVDAEEEAMKLAS